MAIAYLSLGSNIDDRVSYVQQASKLLTESGMVSIVRSSALYETEPWGNSDQNWFINAVIEIKTKLEPRELLTLCNDIEQKLNRERIEGKKWLPRTIDIDILFYGDLTINEPGLTIPHKYLSIRAFVLVPLLELIPDYVHTKFKKSVSELYDAIENPEEIYLYGTRI